MSTKDQRISRRGYLKCTEEAATVIGLASGGVLKSRIAYASQMPTKWDEAFDVVVIGGNKRCHALKLESNVSVSQFTT